MMNILKNLLHVDIDLETYDQKNTNPSPPKLQTPPYCGSKGPRAIELLHRAGRFYPTHLSNEREPMLPPTLISPPTDRKLPEPFEYAEATGTPPICQRNEPQNPSPGRLSQRQRRSLLI